MAEKKPWFDAIDWLLIAAIVGLSAFLLAEISQPAIAVWRNRPRPGVQVCQQYRETNYLLYLPQNYEKDKKWPLLVFLHGTGERGQDLELLRRVGLPKEIEQGVQPEVSDILRNRFILVSPQCPIESGWVPERVVELVEHICNTLPVERDRVNLTGFSMGGFGTWQTACQYPDCFAAIVPLAGGGDVNQADRLKDMPIWAFQGAKDETVPIGVIQAMVDAVRKCGGHVEFTVYPEEGHGICGVTYENPRLYDWLLAQRRGQPADQASVVAKQGP